MPRRFVSSKVLGLMILVPACGTGTGPSGPTAIPTPVATSRAVSVTAFLDENENGRFDTNEGTRIPNVEVVVGSVRGRTSAMTGQVTLDLPEGNLNLEVTAASLPPFYRPPSTMPITVPTSGPVMAPITLPRGFNRANVYMAFGDSITNGEPHIGDGNGYRRILESMLRAHFGSAEVANEGRDASDTIDGADRIGRNLANDQPAFTLIHYGTNDWNLPGCRQVPCFTTTNLRFMVQQVNRAKSHAFLATILPTNTGFDNRAPPSRNDWVAEQNAIIRQVADEEGAVVVDLNGAFLKSGRSLPSLFVDHVHPTAPGYDIMAQTWFDAITKPYSRILAGY